LAGLLLFGYDPHFRWNLPCSFLLSFSILRQEVEEEERWKILNEWGYWTVVGGGVARPWRKKIGQGKSAVKRGRDTKCSTVDKKARLDFLFYVRTPALTDWMRLVSFSYVRKNLFDVCENRTNKLQETANSRSDGLGLYCSLYSFLYQNIVSHSLSNVVEVGQFFKPK
jgi:hypothetical protein